MQGYSPKLPLAYDYTEDGLYALNKTLVETIKQNLKMLLLTNPGERMMDTQFGIGIRRFLFEQDNRPSREELQGRIAAQVARYLSYITIEEINISEPGRNEENTMFLNIRYSVAALSVEDELNIAS